MRDPRLTMTKEDAKEDTWRHHHQIHYPIKETGRLSKRRLSSRHTSTHNRDLKLRGTLWEYGIVNRRMRSCGASAFFSKGFMFENVLIADRKHWIRVKRWVRHTPPTATQLKHLAVNWIRSTRYSFEMIMSWILNFSFQTFSILSAITVNKCLVLLWDN